MELGCTSGTTLEMQNIGMIRRKKSTASPIEITKCHVEFDVDNDILDLTNYYIEELFQKTLNLLPKKKN